MLDLQKCNSLFHQTQQNKQIIEIDWLASMCVCRSTEALLGL